MLFLSKITLDSRSRSVAEQLRDPYKMHQTLCMGFPDLHKEMIQEARLLFRVDNDNGQLFVVAQSKTRPDWSRLGDLPHYAHDIAVKSFDFKPAIDTQLRFRMLANPTKTSSTVRKGTRSNGQRVGLYREWERLNWLKQKGEQHGFSCDSKPFTVTRTNGEGKEETLELDLPLVRVTDLNDGRRFPIKGNGKHFSAALFEGHLRVTNPELLVSALENGIGKARGFGFGLLSLGPATTTH